MKEKSEWFLLCVKKETIKKKKRQIYILMKCS